MPERERIELRGFLLRSNNVSSVLDLITSSGGEYHLVDADIGRTSVDPSRFVLEIEAPDAKQLQDILSHVVGIGPDFESRYFDGLHDERVEELVVPQAILGPDGRPLSGDSIHAHRILTDVREVSRALIQAMATSPSRLYELEPRRFEELVAELLLQQGYAVELTAATRDGGRDIHAVRNEACGSFLYFVECKRLGPNAAVGVEVVRQLYGVVRAEGATAGMIATTSRFTHSAIDYSRKVPHEIALRDYEVLREWLADASIQLVRQPVR